MKYSYICNQKKPCHNSMNCKENGGECYRTEDINYAVHKDQKMQFIEIGLDFAVEVDEDFKNVD